MKKKENFALQLLYSEPCYIQLPMKIKFLEVTTHAQLVLICLHAHKKRSRSVRTCSQATYYDAKKRFKGVKMDEVDEK